MRKNMQLNPLGDGLAFLAMISWGWYSIFDPSADPAESQLETGDTDEVGSPRQFPVSGAS